MRLKRTNKLIKAIAFSAGSLLLSSAAIADYKVETKDTIWGSIYKDEGKTFFCKKDFPKQIPLLPVSRIYSNAQVRDHLQCGTNSECLSSNERYMKITSDLHNIVPSDSNFEFKRKGARFGDLAESIQANSCGIRKDLHVIEPPDDVKGDVARILFHMSEKYDLPLDVDPSLLKQWHEIDPPSQEEISRNKSIAIYQGYENKFISNPSLAYNIDFRLIESIAQYQDYEDNFISNQALAYNID